MAIDPLGSVDKAAVVGDPAQKLYQNTFYEQETRQNSKVAQDTVSISPNKAYSTMEQLNNINEEKKLFAENIRNTDNALRNVSDIVDKMKVHLEKIVKNWPPFSSDSQERKEYLMSCVSLRQEILKMTVPPPPKPVYEKNKIVWDNLGLNESSKFVVPEISHPFTDNQVKTALGKLENLGAAVAAGRNDLLRNVTK